MTKPIFPWEGGYDFGEMVKEYAKTHNLDLGVTRQKFAESQILIAQEFEPGRWISSEMDKLINIDKPTKNSPKSPRTSSRR